MQTLLGSIFLFCPFLKRCIRFDRTWFFYKSRQTAVFFYFVFNFDFFLSMKFMFLSGRSEIFVKRNLDVGSVELKFMFQKMR